MPQTDDRNTVKLPPRWTETTETPGRGVIPFLLELLPPAVLWLLFAAVAILTGAGLAILCWKTGLI